MNLDPVTTGRLDQADAAVRVALAIWAAEGFCDEEIADILSGYLRAPEDSLGPSPAASP